MSARRFAVVGGGILGLAVAARLQETDPDAAVTVWEKESVLASHQTGRNSGVVHAGLYYEPGSLKARLCRRGVGMLREFCQEHGIAYDERGKVLVALDEAERDRLGAIEERARANGVPGIRRLDQAGLRELEPHVRGVAALHSPSTAIVDFPGVARQLGRQVVARGGEVRCEVEATALERTGSGGVVLHGRTADGTPCDQAFDRVVLCAGLHSDHLAERAGDVPDPRYPFLGVHLTPRVDGEVLVGPNAVLALAREGYRWRDVSLRDLAEVAAWPGFRRFARKHWRTGVTEMAGSVSRRRFVAAARRYVPELRTADVIPGPSGIRAQALDRRGNLVDDFRITERGPVLALRNAPSPGATSSLAIAEHLVGMVAGR